MAVEIQLASQQLFVQAFQYAPIGMTLLALNGSILKVNPAACAMLGFSENELLQMTVSDITHPHDVAADLAFTNQLIEGSLELYQSDKRLLNKQNDTIWIKSTLSLIKGEHGDPLYLLSQFMEANDQKLDEEEYQDEGSERIPKERNLQYDIQHHSSLFNHHPDLIYSMDLNGNHVFVNQSFLNTMKYTYQEIVENAMNFRALTDPECLPQVEYHFNQATKGIAQRYEAVAINKNNNYTTFDVTNIPIIVDQQVIGVYGIARDITYQKELTKKLEETQQLYQLFSENVQDIISFATPDGITRYVSPSIKASLGYEPDEYVGKVAIEFWHPDDAAPLVNNCLMQNSDIDIFICRIRHKQGHYVWFETTATIIRNEAGEIINILAVGRDITSRKQAENVLKAAKEQLESFIDHNVDPILIMNLEDKAVRINQAFETMYGWTECEIVGRNITDLPIIPSNLKWEVTQNLVRIKSNETSQGYETVRNRRDGVDLKVTLSSFCIRDENGNISGWAVIMRDITDKKKAEELMIQSEKLSIAGQLAAGIAHEIRNPITAIKGFIQLMKSGVSEKKMYYDIITSEIERIEVILNELLILAKPQVVQLERKDIRVLLAQVTTLLETQAIINNVQIITEFDSSIPHIQCDENQLKQVCINFIKNAIEAMPSGGTLVIQLTSKANNTLLLRFIDQGCGIPAHILYKLGQPFYTTKENGTGLGFMVSKRIIENHHGEVTVFSKENIGTTIEVSFPIVQD
ncbi:PAS domain-containing sensor histidine kinase [Paenibacillus foliorum]|nr:PAS domain-containing sensor histidine kinase [Paenibacillus foliorum]